MAETLPIPPLHLAILPERVPRHAAMAIPQAREGQPNQLHPVPNAGVSRDTQRRKHTKRLKLAVGTGPPPASLSVLKIGAIFL